MFGANDKSREYLKTQIKTASREQLVLMLYDGAIRYSEQAKDRIAIRDYDGAHGLLIRAQDIVLELLYALDRKAGGEVAERLAGLYTYCYGRLVEANVQHLPGRIDESNTVIRSLRDAWAEAMGMLRQAAVSGDTGAVTAAPGGSVSSAV